MKCQLVPEVVLGTWDSAMAKFLLVYSLSSSSVVFKLCCILRLPRENLKLLSLALCQLNQNLWGVDTDIFFVMIPVYNYIWEPLIYIRSYHIIAYAIMFRGCITDKIEHILSMVVRPQTEGLVIIQNKVGPWVSLGLRTLTQEAVENRHKIYS